VHEAAWPPSKIKFSISLILIPSFPGLSSTPAITPGICRAVEHNAFHFQLSIVHPHFGHPVRTFWTPVRLSLLGVPGSLEILESMVGTRHSGHPVRSFWTRLTTESQRHRENIILVLNPDPF
jgi:hypothetical protein